MSNIEGPRLPNMQNVLPDKGCSAHPACLTCPFPDCIWEHNATPLELERRRRTQEAGTRRQAIKAAKQAEPDASIQHLADRFEVSARTVQRALRP